MKPSGCHDVFRTAAFQLVGVLILRRAIWVIILEQRQKSGTYTHAFFL